MQEVDRENYHRVLSWVTRFGQGWAERMGAILNTEPGKKWAPDLVNLAADSERAGYIVGRLEECEKQWVDPFQDFLLVNFTLASIPSAQDEVSKRPVLAKAWALCSLAQGFSYGNLIIGEDFE